jgi:transglutaminase-like putative cysteine protease
VTVNVRMTVVTAVACLLAAIDLLPLFDDALWFMIAIGAVTVVAATGTLTRLRPLPSEACLAAGLVALLLYLNLIFAVRHSWALVIPTPGSLGRLWDLIGTGIHDANRYAPPAPHRPGLLLLAAGGVGLVAVFADWIAVRLRSAALAGLWLLVLFTVPVMMNAPHDQLTTGLGFCLGGAGYLAMLSADGRERIRVWGRLVSLWRPVRRGEGGGGIRMPGPDTRALAAAGRRVGLASIVLALAVPLIVPGLHPSKLFSSGPGIGGRGGGSGGGTLGLPSALSQAVVQIHENHPRTIFTYRTNATASQQASDAEYFRQYVFDTLGSGGWQVDDYTAHAVPLTLNSLPGPQGLTDARSVQTVTTTVIPGEDFPVPGSQPVFLPLPYPAIQVDVTGKWKSDPDLMVYSSEPVAKRSYSVVSVRVDPTRAQLAAVPRLARTAAMVPELQLPSSYRTAALKKLADSQVAGQTTEFGKVNALATWLSGPQFIYSLDARNLTSAAGLVSFLTKVKSGFCVQYAYAMTVLTRLLGIPARFVVGYTGGTRLADGSYQVRNIDAHAWTEVYFPTLGWVRFEPTPAGQGTANAPSYMTSGAGQGQLGPSNPIISQTQSPRGGKAPPSTLPGGRFTQPDGTNGTGAGAHGPSDTPWAAIALAVIAALVLAFALVAIVAPPIQRVAGQPDVIRRRRPHAATAVAGIVAAAGLVALALYRLMARATGLDLGVGWATVGIAFGATAAVALIVPAVFRLVLRRWRWIRAADDIGRAHAAWREFHDDLADFGVSSPSEPPRSLAARVTATLPAPAAEAVARLALAEERASYAPHPAESEQLRRDGTTARRGLSATARRSTRWRAAVFPASIMTTVAEAVARVPDRGGALMFWRRGR